MKKTHEILDQIKDSYNDNDDILLKINELQELIEKVPKKEEDTVEEIFEQLLNGEINDTLVDNIKSIKKIDNIKSILHQLYMISTRVEDGHLKYVLNLYQYLIRNETN
jgi:molybdopterin converting factor small subunit